MTGGRLPQVYRILMECMANTNNHAARGSGVCTWYVHVYYDKKRNRCCFSFVDFGVGILNGLHRTISQRVYLAAMKDAGEVLSLAFTGFFKSITKQPHRGLGLQGIRDLAKLNRVERLVATANNGYVDVSNGRSMELNSSFPGTMLYWEVSKEHVLSGVKRER